MPETPGSMKRFVQSGQLFEPLSSLYQLYRSRHGFRQSTEFLNRLAIFGQLQLWSYLESQKRGVESSGRMLVPKLICTQASHRSAKPRTLSDYMSFSSLRFRLQRCLALETQEFPSAATSSRPLLTQTICPHGKVPRSTCQSYTRTDLPRVTISITASHSNVSARHK